MKGIDIFCASQAATAICLSMDPSSTPSSSSILLGSSSPAIDRYNPIIRDSRRIPCNTPHPPISPKPHKNHHKKKKHNTNKKIPLKENGDIDHPKTNNNNDGYTTSSHKPVDNDDGKIKIANDGNSSTTSDAVVRKSWRCTKPSEFISPPGSTRYLLSDKVSFNAVTDFGSARKLFPAETSNTEAVKTNNETLDAKLPNPSPPSPGQVVVLRVSLHCRGCEKKMRKHISRMEGVTSFNIDFMAKKVTVTGNITPLEVLSSISKVKNAQLWPPTISSSIPPPQAVNLSNTEFKNENKVDVAS